jgi:hypothetical protein
MVSSSLRCSHRTVFTVTCLTLTAMAAACLSPFCLAAGRPDGDDHIPAIEGRVVASGIPGISAISPVGTFLPGGPIHDNPALAAFTQPGRVIDPARILVGSTSNFGAPLADVYHLEGSFLSIDPRGTVPLVIPPQFAAAGGQASALGGLVQMYSAQSPAFLNSIKNPLAPTAGFTGVSNPLGISINNAFGRFWPANAPFGLDGIGSSTILDPAGYPLAGAPNPLQIGGVYAGDLTPRTPQLIPGALNTGAVGTAFLGHSPDPLTRARAVFAVVTADGAIVQEHTQKGLDGLAPPGTISPLIGRGRERDENDTDGGSSRGTRTSPRLGVLLNYSPTRILYVSEPFENSIAAVDLTDDGVIFRTAGVRRLTSEALDQPIDLAPVVMEISNPNWASNTTLDVQSDFYVANRGNNTIVRMRQDGGVVSVRRVRLAGGRSLGNGRLNGITTSPDGSSIWVTVTGRLPGPGRASDYVLELPSF